MCKPASEGGQRCAAHTRKALVKAREALAADPTAYEAVLTAEAEHASTPAGRKELEAEYLAAESPVTRADLREALRRGDEIRERARAAAAAVQARRPPRGFAEALDPDLEFELDAPDDGDGMDMPIFSGTASTVAARLVPGTYRGTTADGRRVRVEVNPMGARVFEEHVSQVEADAFAPGIELEYQGVRTTIVSGPETVKDQFGRDMMQFRARRADTGAEGTMMFGSGGVAKVAPLTAEERAKVYGPEFQNAVNTARENIPVMQRVVDQAYWNETRILLLPSGHVGAFGAHAWDVPAAAPPGRVVGSVDLDGNVTRLA